MRHRIFIVATFTSTLLIVVTISLFIISLCDLDVRVHHLSSTSHCHVAVEHGYIVFFNDAGYGPYRDSVIQLDGFPPIEQRAFGNIDICGLYYRHLRWLDSSGLVLWTLWVSLVYPLTLLAILPTTWLWLRWRQARRPPTTCSPAVPP